MSNTKDFFAKKNEWSIHKDNLLKRYMVPYFTKLMSTNIDIVYIDGFAGKGIFSDGSKGSPLIVKEAIYQAKNISKFNTKIKPYFVEYEYADELIKNLSDKNAVVIHGDYKTQVPLILSDNKGKNIFLYVDPFGIKYLDFSIFANLKQNEYKSIELLLNLNSFGFIREACRLLKYKQEVFDDELPDNLYLTDTSKNTIENMNKVANGDYWQDIVKRYNNSEYDIFEAERKFLSKYIDELKKVFTVVYYIPIKKSKGKLSKYNMIFATNHKDGAMLMANDIIKCNNEMQEALNKGQIWLFDYSFNLRDIEKVIESSLSNTFINLKDFYHKIYTEYGFIYLTSDICKCLRKLEDQNKVIISRYPAKTANGKLTKSMDTKKYTIKIKRR